MKHGYVRVIITNASRVEKFIFLFYQTLNLFFYLAERAAPAKLRALFFFEKKMKLRTPGCVVQADLQMRKNFFKIIFEYCIRKIFPEKYYPRETHRKISNFAEGRINIFDSVR